MEEKPLFYSGTSNIVLPLKQADFPPEAKGFSRLRYYATLYSSVEINASFYKVPRPATVDKWRESVPPHFRFTFKVPKAVTHAKGLQFDAKELALFTEAVAAAGDKKGCLLMQLPPSVRSDKREELEGILESLHSDAKGWKIAVEFRDNSWYNSAIYRVLQHYGAGMVEQDLPRSAAPKVSVAENFSYLRFHGPEGTYRGGYTDSFLAGHAKRIAAWMAEGREVYVYFNNTLGDALKNLDTLNALVTQQVA